MEGITLYPLRNIHRKVFGVGIDKYFTPFLTASHTHHFKNREKKDVLPEKNSAFDDYRRQIVPQIMAANSETFLWAAREMKKLGYEEINLNLGCPAPTVVNRHKGSGLLTEPEYLDRMLCEIYEGIAGREDYPAISLKTRLGFQDPEEAGRLMKIYASYPVKELIIHARVREDYYRGNPRIDAFRSAVSAYRAAGGRADICYNGNVSDTQSYNEILKAAGILCDGKINIRNDTKKDTDKDTSKYTGKDTNIADAYEDSCMPLTAGETDGTANRRQTSEVTSIMIGRGLLYDPALVRKLKGGDALLAKELRTYLGELYEAYAEYIPEDRNVIFKMLEHWAYLHVHFKDCDRQLKAIRKSRSRAEYHAAVNKIFAECEFI